MSDETDGGASVAQDAEDYLTLVAQEGKSQIREVWTDDEIVQSYRLADLRIRLAAPSES